MEPTSNVRTASVKQISDYAVRLILVFKILPSAMLTRRVSANFIFVFHEVKYEVPEYVTNFEGSSQHSSEGLQMIRAQEKTCCFLYVYFIIVLLLLPSQIKKLS